MRKITEPNKITKIKQNLKAWKNHETIKFLTCEFKEYLDIAKSDFADSIKHYRITKFTENAISFYIIFNDNTEAKVKVIIKK